MPTAERREARTKIPNVRLSIAKKGSWLDRRDPHASLERLVEACDSELASLRRERRFISPAYEHEPAIIHAIDGMRWFLSALSANLDSQGVNSVPGDTDGGYALTPEQSALLEAGDNPLFGRIDELWREFEQAAAEVSAQQDELSVDRRKICARIAQRQLYNYLDQSPFVQASRVPPSGQPGDTMVIRMILGEAPTAPTLLGNVIDRWHLNTRVSQAHRNRIEIITDWLALKLREAAPSSGQLRICSLGCGPAREIPRLIARESDNPALARLTFVLEDYSNDALATALEGVEIAGRGARFRPDTITRRTNAFRLAVAYNGESLPAPKEEPFDLVYCAGLYDYLDDEVASAVTRALFHRLKPGGMLLLTNVDPVNPNRGAQEYLLNWPLVYRDHDAMARIGERLARDMPGLSGSFRQGVENAGLVANGTIALEPGEMCVAADATGVNQFLWVRAFG